MPHAAILEDRSVLALTGADARDFLQGLITSDIAQLGPGKAIYAALLTPQGKILFDFLLAVDEGGRILIDCAGARAGDLLKRLGMYRLRAKVTVAPVPELRVGAWWGHEAPKVEGATIFADPRLPALGWRAIAPEKELSRALGDTAPGAYEAHRLALGVPESADIGSDQVFALDAGFEELHGVSFRKGCYVGQEVTARMKHRATARRRFYIAQSNGALPPPGTPLEAQGRELGTLATGRNGIALALVRLDRVEDALGANALITATGQEITLKKPSWLQV